jgi:hypothetical protein
MKTSSFHLVLDESVHWRQPTAEEQADAERRKAVLREQLQHLLREAKAREQG